MADSAGGHRSGSRLKYFCHRHRAICETPVLTVRSDRAGRRVDDVDLLCILALVGCTAQLPKNCYAVR